MQDSEALETLWQRHPRHWCEHRNFAITDAGVTLGADTLIAPIVKDAYGRTTLALDGNEDRILALLSVAHDKPISPVVLENFRAASRALAKGDESLALICLAQSGLFALHGWNYERNADGAAKALFMADQVLQDGMDEGTLLKGLGLLPEGLSPAEWHALAKYNHNHVHAGCPEGGQFCSEGEAGGGDGSIPIPDLPKPPEPYASWDAYNARNPQVPDYKSEVVDQDDSRDFNRAADALPGQTPTQSFVYREVFAAEGGSEPANNGYVAGISPATLNGAIKAKVDGIDGNTTLDDLTTEQIASIYHHEFDRSLGLVGGSAALDRVGDPGAAAALGDTLFWFGDTGGANVVRQAIADASGSPVEGSGRLGPVVFDRYSQLAKDPDTRQTLLDNLADQRRGRAERFPPVDEGRIQHFRFLAKR